MTPERPAVMATMMTTPTTFETADSLEWGAPRADMEAASAEALFYLAPVRHRRKRGF
jgi:hypothetical protein